jgi:hypothetical protein
MGTQKALISFILNICNLQLFTLLFSAFPRGDFMSDLPQITYGNMALIFLSHFHGYNKN